MSGILATAGRDIFRLGFEISPIILTGGIAADIPGQMLPIIAITESASVITGFLNGSLPNDLDQYFAHFKVLAGSTLAANQIGHYPFANQQVAANAIIQQPLNVSLTMTCPVQQGGGYVDKLATLTALQAVLSQHNASGGLYTVATPGFLYTNCVMLALTDATDGTSNQVQYQYQFDFEQPLVTLAAAQQAYSSLINKLTNGTQITGQPSWSGVGISAGSQSSGATASAIYGAQNLSGRAGGIMTTITPFTPTANQAFQFTPTLDGDTYTALITWNVYGQRWYLNLTDNSGNLIVCRAMVESPDGFDINLVFGYFQTSTLVFRDSSQSFEVTP